MTFITRFPKEMVGVAIACFSLFCSCGSNEKPQIYLIPKPAQMEVNGGYFQVDSSSLFGETQSDEIQYILDNTFQPKNPEAYDLQVTKRGVVAKASSEAGLFYAKQTLRQLYTSDGLPCVTVKDAPRFSYRGLHLDVSRHFFDKKEVIKLLDVMSYYKLNTLHLHLTDAGGWRIQMDKYPKLTSEAAYRTKSDWAIWWDGKERKFLPEGTEGAYGGYYTKEDIREIVSYASQKHINILPEIEFPGHSEEVFAAYPELKCVGAEHSGDFCIGNEKSFKFMEDVFTEIIDLFPYKYVHVGGDEAGKAAWKKCPKCQALMKQKGMKHVDELQSYMIHRAEEFLNSKGRKLIGWDEILQGGLAPEATVMSWRGEEGGIKSARMGHDVIMTPGSHLYFDFYQADPKTQPYAIGGYTPIKHVYSYNPVPVDSLTEEQGKHIIGVQANTWTEYMPNEKHLEYMIFPRALALAEVAWTPQENRSWEDFKPRMNANISVLQRMGINTFTLSDEIEATMKVDTLKKEIEVCLDAEKYPVEIRYTRDGSEPTATSAVYEGPIVVKDSAHVKAAIFLNGQMQGKPTEKKVDYHRGINRPIHYNSKLFKGYMAGGMNALLDGYRGGLTYLDGRWQGYLNDLDCVVDMGEVTDIHKVSSRFMQLIGPGVFQPKQVELLMSEDGEHFVSQGFVQTTISNKDKDLSFQEYTFSGNWKARYIRVKAEEANGGFIFTDEIVIW